MLSCRQQLLEGLDLWQTLLNIVTAHQAIQDSPVRHVVMATHLWGPVQGTWNVIIVTVMDMHQHVILWQENVQWVSGFKSQVSDHRKLYKFAENEV